MISENENVMAESNDEFFDHKFDDIEVPSKKFDAVERDRWQMPEKVIETLSLSDYATVAEIGAGTGYFAVRLAEHLKEGKVIALDKEPKLVEYIKIRAEYLALTNIEARLAETGGEINLTENVDLILSVDMYHHVPNRISYFSKFIEHLKPGGKLVIIDRRTDSPDSQSFNRIPIELVIGEMKEAGLRLSKTLIFCPTNTFLFLRRTGRYEKRQQTFRRATRAAAFG